MALITSAASGNFNAGATWTGGVVPTVGDEARAATGHTITITANATCDEVSNAGTGIFTLNDGVTLTANVTNKSTTTSRNCLQFTAASPAAGTIVGNCTGGTVTGAQAAANTSTGTLNITGNIFGGSGGTSTGAVNNSTGTINITGNCTAGSSSFAYGAFNNSSGIVNITGNCFGGSASAAYGVGNNAAGGVVTITGNATGGSIIATTYGAANVSTGTINISGIAEGGVFASGANNATAGTINLGRAKGNAYGPGNTSGLVAAVGASNAGLGVIEVEELEFGQYGMNPTSGTGIRLKKVSTNQAIFTYVDAGSAKTLVDATQGQMPAATDVRTGVSYASGALTGTCAVPSAASVGFGVPVDATTGTAALTPASVWDHLLSAITTSSTIGTLLKTNIDATISSRSTATTAGIADAVWDEVLTGATHNIATSAGRRLRALGNQIILENSAVTSTTNSITFNGLASAITGAYDPALIYIVEGTGVGQCRNILEYRGATKTAIVDRDWRVLPDDTSNYVIVANAGREHVNEGAAAGGSSNTIILNASASATDDAYNGQVVFIRSGTGADQARRVVGYVGSTRTATVDRAWATTPTTESAYVMLPTGEFSQDYVSVAIRTELTPELDEIGEIHAIHGLKTGDALTVTPTSRIAGAISQTISGDGTTTTTVSRD